MISISVYIDTNCINARQNDVYINELEKLYDNEKILIEKTDTLDTELQDGKGYPKGTRKSLKYIESFGVAVVNHSRVGSSIIGNTEDDRRLVKILEILWGKKTRSSYSKQDTRDAMHLSTAIRYGGTFFVTIEKALLKKAKKIEKEFEIKIKTPKDCLLEVKNRLKQIKELEE